MQKGLGTSNGARGSWEVQPGSLGATKQKGMWQEVALRCGGFCHRRYPTHTTIVEASAPSIPREFEPGNTGNMDFEHQRCQ
mmetsp:Transcript_70132/g.116952  ORF Transcript_70132/g.116952 Transcript_70132/m.116952 type:complete len:81 (-) Transcript_70132:29-271(-)